MEFNEKLQELRKSKGMTQEELAEVLYVSRTAISKWESGRGYPSIDSLKEISKFFSVTIDDLLSSENVLSIARRENQSNMKNICDLLFGIMDILTILLILLPLYPKTVNGYIYSVNLFSYTELMILNRVIDWIMFVSMTVLGIVEIMFNQIKIEKGRNTVTAVSLALNIAMILFLALTRQTYAIIVAFLLLVIKGIIIIKKRENFF